MKKKLSIIMGVLLIAVMAFGLTACDNENPDNHYYKRAGEYKVGADIDAGEYLLISDKQSDGALSSAYYQVTTQANAQVSSGEFLYNDNFYYRTYVRVADGQYLKFSSCKLYKIEDYPAVDKNASSWHSGQYKVGVDLDAGDYKLTALADSGLSYGYVALTKTPNGKIGTSDFLSNDTVQGQKYLTLEENTYISFSSCTLTKV